LVNKAQLAIAPGSTGIRVSGGSGKAPARLRTPVDHQRSEFLRRCRARLTPEDVGLPPLKRARNGGLRREDVAALSGVSTSWYTWLEQGRDIRVSDGVLDRVSQTLRMSDDERIYLFSLVQHRLPRLDRDMGTETPPDVLRMIRALPHPAVVMNLRCDILAWNSANCALYYDYGLLPPGERNLLEVIFTRPVRTLTPEQVENAARRLVGRLRFDYSKCADDPRFDALFHRLMALSPVFKRLWHGPEVALNAFGMHTFEHPRFGLLTFEHTTYVPDGHPYIRVVICTAENAAARRAVAIVTAEQAAAQSDTQREALASARS
jgi:transcriptional regulator with XRE-family HTH domain